MAPPPTDDASGRPVSDEGDAADTPADDRATSRGDPGSGCGAGPAAPHPNLAPAAEPGAADDHAVGAPPHAAAHAQPTERRAPEADCSDAVGPARAPSGRPPGGAAPVIDTDAELADMAAYARHSAKVDAIAASHGMRLPGTARSERKPFSTHKICILKAHTKHVHTLYSSAAATGSSNSHHSPLDSSQPSSPHNALPVSFLVYFTIKLAVSHTYFNLAPGSRALGSWTT